MQLNIYVKQLAEVIRGVGLHGHQDVNDTDLPTDPRETVERLTCGQEKVKGGGGGC